MTDKPQPNPQPEKAETPSQDESKKAPVEQSVPKPDSGVDAPKSDSSNEAASDKKPEVSAAPAASSAEQPKPDVKAAAEPAASDSQKPEEKPAPPANDAASEKPDAPPASEADKSDTSHTDPTERNKPERSAATVPIPGADKFDTQPPEPKSGMPTPNTIICPTCQHHNRPGTLICENCGTNLMTGGSSVAGTRDLKREQEAAVKEGEKLLDTEEVSAVASAGTSTFTEDMVLRIEVEGGSTPMLVYPKQEIILGRRDPTSGGMPDVDMTAYAGYRMGVSRRHAAIRLQEKRLHVSDLGSSNGTFLNGTRLTAHRPYELRDGDEIRLGQMVMKVYFQSQKDRT